MHRLLLAALLVSLVAGCSSADRTAATVPAITGTVTYRERIALPHDAVIEVQLLDITKPDAPGTILNTVTISSVDRLPVFFRIRYDPDQIQPKNRYALKARILVGGKLRFLNTNGALVLTGDNPSHRDLVLEMARE